MKRVSKFIGLLLVFCMLLVPTGCGKKEEVTVYDIHTEAQANYLKGDYALFKEYANGTEEISRPQPVLLEVACAAIVLSEKSDLSEAKTYNAADGKVEIYNLKTGVTYYYRDAADASAEIKNFTTAADAPRNLYIDGVTNVRDLGGWATVDGKKVKQGVVFRSAKYNADESTELVISEKGIDTLVNELGIKTEIDLRTVDDNENGGITESVLGNGVTYYSVPLVSNGNILQLNKESLPELFAIFGDEANYPIVFHCSIGTDRTGMLAFLINCLMGVSEEDLYRDYLFSNFGYIGSMRTPSSVKTYIQTIGLTNGSNLSEKAYNYLVNLGVNSADLDTLRRMLTE